jgi:hypothetical protein
MINSAPGASDADEFALEVAQAARTKLIEVEVVLRGAWYESIDIDPPLAARINVAVRHVHQAAEALAPETVF